jgi:hypothetical protein
LPSRWNWRLALIAFAFTAFVVWGGYFFHVSRLKTGNGMVEMTFPNREPFAKNSVGRILEFMGAPLRRHFNLIVPAGEYVEGVANLFVHNHNGHQSYLLGKISDRPTLAFYPVAALLKWPSVVWLLLTWSLILFFTRRLKLPANTFILLLFPAFYLLLIMYARITMGERHFLPIYPFALLFASAVWEFAIGRSNAKNHGSQPGKKTLVVAVIVVAVVLNAADALRYAPDYLSYFTILIPNRRSYKFLTDSNLDWGQGLLALRKYETAHPDEHISLAYFGSVDPAVYGIRATPMKEGERVSGTVVIGATDLSGQYLPDPAGYRWVTKYPLKAILNHSLFVFEVPSAVENSKPMHNN